jgi:mannose-6-phosphate isomerase-like protein (cupin superfamily)
MPASKDDDKYPNLRRVITGHDKNGRAGVMIDGPCVYHGEGSDSWRVQDIWEAAQVPVSIDATEPDPTAGPVNFDLPDRGIRVRVTDIPPTKPGFEPYRHRTNHMDFLHVLEGEICMQFDDEEGEITLRKGDTLVQRATNHAWINRSDKHCRLFILMVAARITPDLEKIVGPMPVWDPHHKRE